MGNKYITVSEAAAASGFTTQYIYKILNKMQTNDKSTYKKVLKSDKGKKLINEEVLFEYMGIDMPTEEKTVKTEINASDDSKDAIIKALNDRIADLQARIESLEEDKRNYKAMYDDLNERFNYEQQIIVRKLLPAADEAQEVYSKPVEAADQEDEKAAPAAAEPPKRGGWFSRLRR